MGLNNKLKHHPTTTKRPEKQSTKLSTTSTPASNAKCTQIKLDDSQLSFFRRMQYIMVLYEVRNNAIVVQSMQNWTSGEMVATHNSLVNQLKLAACRFRAKIASP